MDFITYPNEMVELVLPRRADSWLNPGDCEVWYRDSEADNELLAAHRAWLRCHILEEKPPMTSNIQHPRHIMRDDRLGVNIWLDQPN